MVTLKIQKTSILVEPGSNVTIDTTFLLDYALNFPIKEQKGFNSEDIFKRVRIKQAIKEIKNDELSLEDSDAIALQEIIKDVEWFAPHEDIATFISAVKELPIKNIKK